MARRVQGGASIRRLFRSLPDAARDEIATVLDDGSREIERQMVARAPRRTGALQAGIKRRLRRNSLSVSIGITGTKAEKRKLFYARILDLGRKGQTVTANRRSTGGGTSRYTMRVRAIGAKRFVTGRYSDARAVLNSRLKGVWDRILRRVAGGE